MVMGKAANESARYPMPLLCSSFECGELETAVAAVEDPDLRNIARAEAFYFSARPEEAFDAAGPYLQSDDPALRLSACFICAYASLSLDRPIAAKKCLMELRSLKVEMLSGAPQTRAAYVLLATASAVLLHLDPSFTEADLVAAMRNLPEGLALFASYVQAHRAYFHGEHGRSIGIAENALAMARRSYPISEQFLHLVAAMGWISLKDVGRARDHFEQAWAIAAADDLIEEIGEHHGLLQGVLIAASTLAALRSGIFSSAISLTCALVILATLSRLGRPEACSRPQAFLIRTAAGGVLVMKVNERS